MDRSPSDITELLHRWRDGDSDSADVLFQALLPDLRRIAAYCFRRERSGHTLQPTALVNEAFLRLAVAKGIDWQNRGHFLAVAARIMRRYLIDHARKRPEALFLPIDGLPQTVKINRTNLELAIAIDALLDNLALESERQRTAVELKFFLGLSDAEAAEALQVTLHTFQREWYRARKWLYDRLNQKPCGTLPNTINM